MQIGHEKMFDILAIPAYGEHIKKGSSLTKLSKIQD